MRLSDLLQTIQPVRITGSTSMEITGVNIDSRLIGTGHLFMAMRGTQTDGHAYIPAAIDKGAVAVLCEELPEELKAGITYIQVKDSEDAVGKVATTFYGDPTSKMELIGVTGTNGKTTVATLLYNTFRYFGYKVGLVSTVCNYIDDQPVPTEHTTPDPITLNRLLGEMADSGCKYAFMEVSSHSIAQKRISGLKFAGGIFTNLTRDHLDYHKTVENYLKAKKKFFDELPKGAFSLTNLDDKNGLVMTQNTRSKVYTYSLRILATSKAKSWSLISRECCSTSTITNWQYVSSESSMPTTCWRYSVLPYCLARKKRMYWLPQHAASGNRPLRCHPFTERLHRHCGLCAYSRRPGQCIERHSRSAGRKRESDYRCGRRRQPRQRQASHHGQRIRPLERPGHHHLR